MPLVIYNGTPGESWTNTTPKVLFQLFVQWSNSCGLCCQFDRSIGPYWPVPFHRGCRCVNRPVLPGQEASPWVDFREKIRDLDPHQQAHVVGVANLRLIEAGVVPWEEVVTRVRIRDLREVVSRQKLSVETLRKAGVSKATADHAFAAVNTPAHLAADANRQAVVDRLIDEGLNRQQVKQAFGERIVARVGIGKGPSGPSSMSVVPTTPKPIVPLIVTPKVAEVPSPRVVELMTEGYTRQEAEQIAAAEESRAVRRAIEKQLGIKFPED